MIDKLQLQSLTIPVDISEGEYHFCNGLLQKIVEYRVTPFYEGTGRVRNGLLLNDDVIGVDFVPSASLFVIRTVLGLDAVKDLLSGLIGDEFDVLPLCSLVEYQG